jgi:hypothetical protein
MALKGQSDSGVHRMASVTVSAGARAAASQVHKKNAPRRGPSWRMQQNYSLEGEARCKLELTLRVQLGAGDLSEGRVMQVGIRIGELGRVRDVEGIGV